MVEPRRRVLCLYIGQLRGGAGVASSYWQKFGQQLGDSSFGTRLERQAHRAFQELGEAIAVL
jgi:hypothetical protein